VLTDFNTHCQDIVSGENMLMEEVGEQCLERLQPVELSAVCRTGQVNSDYARTHLFPELGDR